MEGAVAARAAGVFPLRLRRQAVRSTGRLLLGPIRLIFWIRLGQIVATAEQALRQLSRARILASALNAAFSIWALMLFDSVDAASRAPLSLLIFLGSVGCAYCLGSFPSAARLTLLSAHDTSPRHTLAKPHSLRLLQAFDKVKDDGTRVALLAMVECLAGGAAKEERSSRKRSG